MRHSSWKARVRDRFSAAVKTYDSAATSHQDIATALANVIRAVSLPPAPRVAEIGCGTGFLTSALVPVLHPRRWRATDVATPMLAATRNRLNGLPGSTCLETALMDGEHPDLPTGGWDLICSNLAAQWFLDLSSGLHQLHATLAPGGLLAVTTLGNQTFSTWNEACTAEGIVTATSRYPTLQDVQGMCPGATVKERLWPLPAHSERSTFLKVLRSMGSDTPPPGAPRATPAALRRALRRLPNGDGGSFHVLTILWRKPA